MCVATASWICGDSQSSSKRLDLEKFLKDVLPFILLQAATVPENSRLVLTGRMGTQFTHDDTGRQMNSDNLQSFRHKKRHKNGAWHDISADSSLALVQV